MKFRYNSSYVREKGESMSVENKGQEKKAGKLQWFFFVIVIPIVFSVTLFIVILNIAGINVGDSVAKIGSNIPFVSSFFEETGDNEAEKTDNSEKKLKELETLVKDYESQIESLEMEVQAKEDELLKKEQEIEQLTSSLEQKESNAEQAEMELKNLSNSFKDMDPEKAAPIFEEMEQSLAIAVLKKLKADERGAIFEYMDPAKVATLSSAFID